MLFPDNYGSATASFIEGGRHGFGMSGLDVKGWYALAAMRFDSVDGGYMHGCAILMMPTLGVR